MLSPKALPALFRKAADGFLENNALRLAAAISYTTVFSLSPLLVITVAVVGLVLGNKDAFVQQQIVGKMTELMGASGGQLARTLIENGRVNAGGSVWATVIGVAVLLFSSTALFAQIQDALNTVWGLKPKPSGGAIVGLLRTRLLSFGMVLTVAFLLLVSLIVSVVISALVAFLPDLGVLTEIGLQVANFVVPTAIITLLFALLFRYLPDAHVPWRDVWVGALSTSLLFNVGKVLIGLYLGRSSAASTFGAAGSLVVLLLWVYYSSMILLFGAELTQAYAAYHGHGVVPTSRAVRVVTKEVELDADASRTAPAAQGKALAAAPAPATPAPSGLLRLAAVFGGAFLVGRLTKRSRRPKVTIRAGR